MLLRRDTRSILLVRTDAIGDMVLAAGMLEPLRRHCSAAHITVACQHGPAEVLAECPYVDELVPFDRARAYADEAYRARLIDRLRNAGPEVVLNTVYSREPLTDMLALGATGTTRVAWGAAIAGHEDLRTNDAQYAHVLPPMAGTELRRHKAYLAALGVNTDDITPRTWLSRQDETWAAEFVNKHGLTGKKVAVAFAGAGSAARTNDQIGPALRESLPQDGSWRLVTVGTATESAANQALINASGLAGVNACGLASLRQAAALIARADLAVGAETGWAHLACAVGTPNVVVLGGGHFGRFMPYSKLTTAACVPLTCYRCDWRCMHAQTHCVRDVHWQTIAETVRVALAGASNEPRVVVQTTSAVAADLSQVGTIGTVVRTVTPTAASVQLPSPGWTPRGDIVVIGAAGELAAALRTALEQNPLAAVAYAALTGGGMAEVFARPGPYAYRRGLESHIGPWDRTLVHMQQEEFLLRALAARVPAVPVDAAVHQKTLNADAAWEMHLVQRRHWQAEWGMPPGADRLGEALQRLREHLARQAPGRSWRIALYGAGRHTRRHLSTIRTGLAGVAEVIAVLDDAPAVERIENVPVLATHCWRELRLDAVLPSSDTYEQAMAERLRETTGAPVLRLYGQ